MAIGSALAGMNAAAYQAFNAANGIASGNLDNAVDNMAALEMAKIQFAASAQVAQAQSDMENSLDLSA